MKNKIIVFLVLFLMPFVVNASSISLSCNSNTVKGTSLKCTLKGDSSDMVTAVSAKVRTGSNISFSSFEPSSIWQGDGEDGKIDLYTASDIEDDFVIGILNFNITPMEEGGNTTITIDSVYFYDENGIETSINPITKKIRLASFNNDLFSLSLSTGNLNPKFSSDVTSYSTTIDASSVTINAKAKVGVSTISGDVGEVKLKYGNNTFKVIVTSESGKSKTYTINIVRPNNKVNDDNKENNTQDNTNNTVSKSSNTNLKSISLSSGNIDFDKKVTNYSIDVPYNVTKIEVTATAEDSKSKVEINGNENLVVGNNKIQIKVIAEDNSSKIYVINVERKEEDYVLSSNNYISSINIKDYDIDFDKNKYDYTLKIMREEELDIEVLLEDSKASYDIKGNSNLKDDSVIEIVVTAEDGSTRTYNINIESNDRYIKATFILIIIILLIINIIRLFLKYRREKNEGIN